MESEGANANKADNNLNKADDDRSHTNQSDDDYPLRTLPSMRRNQELRWKANNQETSLSFELEETDAQDQKTDPAELALVAREVEEEIERARAAFSQDEDDWIREELRDIADEARVISTTIPLPSKPSADDETRDETPDYTIWRRVNTLRGSVEGAGSARRLETKETLIGTIIDDNAPIGVDIPRLAESVVRDDEEAVLLVVPQGT